MAIAVDDCDVARPEQRLHRHLVRSRGAVGHEENLVGAKGARGFFLRFFDIAGRLQQAVEAAGGRAALGQEQVGAIELAHIANPVRPEDRLAARDRQRVERPDRALGVFLQIVEEWGFVAVLHAFQNGEVQLEQLFHRVEDASNDVGFRIAGELLHVPVRDHVDIEL
ncbi:MAG TPA: hypothetical protein VGR40_00665, partial [Candidatus Binatus sp.]|nr:hypothetical protein [Candidatus Binatus sp.]